MSFSKVSTLRKKFYCKIDFEKIKNDILGRKYELSLVFCGDKLIKNLSIKYKNSSKHKNILSFPIDKTEGEIFININQVKKEAKHFGHGFCRHLLFLYIHGLLHLKGKLHSCDMEKEEEKLLIRYSNLYKL